MPGSNGLRDTTCRRALFFEKGLPVAEQDIVIAGIRHRDEAGRRVELKGFLLQEHFLPSKE